MSNAPSTTTPPLRTVVLLTDRSRTIDYQECHRKRFLGYQGKKGESRE